MTAAALSLLLPEGDRLGIWPPLHLALAGDASVAIAGAMQNFALALTAAQAPAGGLVLAQFVLVNAGAGRDGWPRAGRDRAGLALGGGGPALLKAWAFGPLGRAPVLGSRQLDVWGA